MRGGRNLHTMIKFLTFLICQVLLLINKNDSANDIFLSKVEKLVNVSTHTVHSSLFYRLALVLFEINPPLLILFYLLNSILFIIYPTTVTLMVKNTQINSNSNRKVRSKVQNDILKSMHLTYKHFWFVIKYNLNYITNILQANSPSPDKQFYYYSSLNFGN